MADGQSNQDIDLFGLARSRITRSFIEYEFGAPGAYWSGPKFMTLNPTRDDKTIKSFSIREDGKWYEFADGSNGDVFDLIAARDGIEPVQAVKAFLGEDAQPYTAAPKHKSKKAKPSEEALKPDWKPIPAGYQPQFDPAPDDLTLYHDLEGRPMFYVARYNGRTPAEGKEIFPMYYEGAKFVKGLPPNLDYRPLFLISKSGKTVIVVEGELKRRIAQEALPGYAITCWHGGARVASKVVVDSLAGCDVVLWPDADQVGREAMLNVAQRLSGIAARVRIVAIPDGVAKGWDIADALREGRDAATLIETAVDYVSPIVVDSAIWRETEIRPFTDLGNAERFVARWGSFLRYNVDKAKWTFWSGKVWFDDDQSLISDKVKATIRDIAILHRNNARAWSKKCESAGRISAMLSLASNEPGIPIHEATFDQDPMLFNVSNGMIDLKTGELRKHEKTALCSKIGAVEYHQDAKREVFNRFLDDITLERRDYQEFLQRWFGYALTADVSAQSFTIFYGNGANGKSTLVELMTRIMGGYAKTAAPDTFIQKSLGSGIPNDVAALRGARLVLASETEANARLAESKIKSMTGGDTVVARFMRAEFFEFQPTWKIVISTNHRPKVSGADYGIWRRIVLVPFDFIAQGEKLDPQMPRKLWAEREGIFSWMVEGAVKWARDGMGRRGLGISDELMQETQEYRQDEDIVGRFVADKCITEVDDPLGRPKEKILAPATELFTMFINWAQDSGEKYAAQMTQTAFGRAMRERGFEGRKVATGKAYIGIQLRRD